MHDLFQVLRESRDRRGHPVLTALLYTFCPMAARWWLAGAEPGPFPPNPYRVALDDLAGGLSLRKALERRGLTALREDVRRYAERVEAIRQRYKGHRAPEIYPITDSEPQLSFRPDVGLYSRLPELGDFHAYARTYLYLYEEWATAILFDVEHVSVQRVQLSLQIPGSTAVRWPAWVWSDGSGRQVLTLLEDEGDPPAVVGLVAALADRADRADGAWTVWPEFWLLDPQLGTARVYQPVLASADKKTVVGYLHRLATRGPHVPLRALEKSGRCTCCPFRLFCWEETPHKSALREVVLQERKR